MNKQEHTRRKRAIYTGLHPYFSDEQIMEALVIWETKYANAPGFSVRYYVADLIERIKPAADTKQILINLVATLSKPERDLLPDPSDSLESYKRFNRIQVNADFSIPILEAFQLFIVKWLKQADTKVAEAVVKDVAREIYNLEIASDLSAKITDWLSKKIDRIRLPYVDAADLRKVVNLFYVSFCRHSGPVQTDEVLSQAVQSLRSNGGAAYTELFKKIL